MSKLLHCGMGMVGSINAPTSGNNTHDAFVAAAKAIGASETNVSFRLWGYQAKFLIEILPFKGNGYW